MALVAYTDYANEGTVAASSASTATIGLVGFSFDGNDYDGEDPVTHDVQYGIGAFTADTADEISGEYSSSATVTLTGLQADRIHQLRGRASNSHYGTKFGATLHRYSTAVDPTWATPGSSSVTSISATISCSSYFPNTNEHTATVWLEYKRTVDSTWIQAGASDVTSGYGTQSISRNLSGLNPATQYDFRLRITRTTVTGTSFTSATQTFTTLAGEPTVTTNAATSVGSTSATLNGTLDINEGTGVNVHFVWDTVNPPVANVTANQSMSSDGPFQQAISVSASTLYYFKAVVTFSTPTGSPNEGSVLSFTTPADPAAEALLEDHVIIREFNERKYKTATKVVFTVAAPASGGGASSDRFFNSASPFVAGDVKVAQEATPGAGLGSFTNVGTLPVRIGTTPAFELSLTAAEMTGSTIVVMVVDQDGPAYRDTMLVIRTAWEQGTVDVDASQYTNQTAFKVTGAGTGHGLSAVRGASGKDIDGLMEEFILHRGTAQTHGVAGEIKLATSANANDSWFDKHIVMIIGGTGAGQARAITSYVGATRVATVDTSWVQNPDNTSVYIIIPGPRVWEMFRGECAALPADNANFGLKFQLIFQRFAFKITQTTILQTLFKADSSTALATRSVSDAAGTQTIGKLS